jgi:hypothetical protein
MILEGSLHKVAYNFCRLKSPEHTTPGANGRASKSDGRRLGYFSMRLAEGVNLTWEDMDWDRETFIVTDGERGRTMRCGWCRYFHQPQKSGGFSFRVFTFTQSPEPLVASRSFTFPFSTA